MKPAPHDLSSLIGAAQTEVARAQSQHLAQRAPPSRLARHARLAGSAIALAIAASQLLPLYRGGDRGQTAKDLDAIIEQARQAVDAALAAQGRLPDALPNAALAGLVAYTPVGNSYQLFAASGGVSVTLEPDGKKTVKQGSAP